MQMFRVPAGMGGGDASIIVTSDHGAAGESSNAYALAQVADLEQKFSGFRLLSMGEVIIDGVAAAVIDYEWLSNNDVFRQRHAYVPSPRCMFTLTLTARASGFPQLEAAWDQVVGSIRLRGEEPTSREL